MAETPSPKPVKYGSSSQKMPRMLRWLLFSVAMALVPFVVVFLDIRSQGGSVSLETFTRGGDVLILAAALAASALGELAGNNLRHKNMGILAGFGCVTVVMVASNWYGRPAPVDQLFFAWGSIVLLLCATLMGVLCIWISE